MYIRMLLIYLFITDHVRILALKNAYFALFAVYLCLNEIGSTLAICLSAFITIYLRI